MIYLLKIDDFRKHGLLSRLISRGLEISCVRRVGADFCTLTVDSRKPINWCRISAAMGKDEKLLVPRGISVPAGVPLTSPDGERIRHRMIADGAVSVLEDAAGHGAELSVLVIDKSAVYSDLIPATARCAHTLTVMTDRADLYEQTVSETIQNDGAAVMLTDDVSDVSKCDMIIAPDGIIGCGALPLPEMIFAPTGSDCVSLSAECVDLCELSDLSEYDPFALITAVYSDSGNTEYRPASVGMMQRDRMLTVQQLANRFYA